MCISLDEVCVSEPKPSYWIIKGTARGDQINLLRRGLTMGQL